MKRLLGQLTRNGQALLTTVALCHRITPAWRPAYPRLLLRARRLCRREGFEPVEAFRLGLFQPHSRRRRYVEYVSRRRLARIQESLNPAAWTPLLRNRDLFYRYCMAIEVPIPQLYGVIHGRLPGWVYTGHVLRTPGDWMAFFDNSLPAEFVAKPTQAVYGRGLCLFQRTPQGYADATGAYRDAGELYDLLAGDATAEYVIQERLESHPELGSLSGMKDPQTLRMINLVGNDGQVHILHAHLMIAKEDKTVNSPLDGPAGSIEAPVDLYRGALRPAHRVSGTGEKVMTIPAHPKTKVRFEGFRLPLWAETCHVARQTALKFVPIRTVEWNIALTPDGPIIVEGNPCWDPPNQHGNMGEILRALNDPILPRTQRSERALQEQSPWRTLFTDNKHT